MSRIFRSQITILVLTTALTLALFWAGLQILNSGKIVYGVTLAGLKIGGQKVTEAKIILENKIKEFSQEKITFVFGQNSWQFTPKQLGSLFETEAMLTTAASLGHRPRPLDGLVEQIQSLILGLELPATFLFETEKFNWVLTNFAAIEKPAQNAALVYNQKINGFEILPAQKGKIVSRDQLVADLSRNLSRFSSQSIYLKLAEETPTITEEVLKPIKAEVQKIVEQAPYWLQAPTEEIKSAAPLWPIGKEQLTDWVSVLPAASERQAARLTLNQNKIKDFLVPLAPAINREPINAKLTSVDNEVKILAVAQDGQKLNVEQSSQKVIDGILAGAKNIELITDSIAPEITNENLDILGLTSLLGSGESNFVGSPENRRHNIALGTAKLSGLLIKPGEEFSFAQNIGEIDEKNGWLPELVIKNKKTLPEYGGGICQISTTLFRAAVNAGLKITERYPHAYVVRYYHPAGFDATVYPPEPDLKFLNNTPNYLLLQSKIQETKLFFEIYGTADDRQVKVKGPTITESNPDGSLKTVLIQEVWREGKLDQQSIFRSSYKSPDLYPIATSTPN